MSVTRPLIVPTTEQRAAADPSTSVWVSANAGSGKTHVLVDRLTRLMLDGVDPSTILCLTFTKSAAAEMANRLLERLGFWVIADEDDLRQRLEVLGVKNVSQGLLKRARQLFTLALETPGGLKVQTIHAFCQNLLHLFPVEAGLAPGFEVMSEEDAAVLRAHAWSDVQQHFETDPDSDLAKAFLTLERYFDQDKFDDVIRALVSKPTPALEALSGLEGFAAFRAIAAQLLEVDPSYTESDYFGQLVELDPHICGAIIRALPFSGSGMVISDALRAANPEAVADILRAWVFISKGSGKRVRYTVKPEVEKHPHEAQLITQFFEEKHELFVLHDSHLKASLTASLLFIATAVLKSYQNEKRKRGKYDFADLISKAADMLTKDQAAQWVLYKLDGGISHILVDEAQDTNPLQWSIIQSLTEEFFAGQGRDKNTSRTVFVVGDRKQSIYSFQGADAALFETTRQLLAERIKNAKQDYRDEKLLVSYRSVQDVLDVVDTVFPEAALTKLGFSSASGSDLHQSSRMGERGRVEIWPTVIAMEEDDPELWIAPVDFTPENAPRKVLARLLAERIKSWIGCRMLVARNRPVRADDILIVMQRRSPLFGLIIAELRRAQIPVAGADRLKLETSIAVQDLIALAQFSLLPQDNYSLACVLKSPLLENALSEEEVFELAHDRGDLSLWDRLVGSENRRDTVRYLQDLSKLAKQVDPHQFFATVLTLRRKAMVERLGPESIDATHAFVDLALDYVTTTSSSLAGFIAWFLQGDVEIKRDMDKPTGEVRIMTVHGAKGLEANIVIIPDATEQRYDKHEGFYMSREGLPVMSPGSLAHSAASDAIKAQSRLLGDEEHMRLLYVAMTRACDELYICGSLGKKLSSASWYAHILGALANVGLLSAEQSEALARGDGAIVSFGPEPAESSAAPSDTPSDDMPDWALPAPLSEQARIEHVAKTYSDTTLAPADDVARRRGTAMHKLLQLLPDWSDDERHVMAHKLGANLDLSAHDVALALGIIALPDLAPLYSDVSAGEVDLMVAPGQTRRVDRMAVSATDIHVLDYKTGKGGDLPEHHPYVQQIGEYASILAEAYPGRTLKAAVVWTDSGTVTWIDTAVLSQIRDRSWQNRRADLT